MSYLCAEMRVLLFFACTFCINQGAAWLYAQPSLARQIERLYYKGDYASLVQKAAKAEKLSPRTLLYWASAHYRLGQSSEAYTLYGKAFAQLDPTQAEAPFLAEYGRLCVERGETSQAIQLFQMALQKTTAPDSQALLNLYLAQAQQLKNYVEDPPKDFRWVVHNLRPYNSAAGDYSLFIHKGRVYFISRRDPARGIDPNDQIPYESLYEATLADSLPKPVRFFGSKHEGIAGFVGDTLVVYRSARRRGDFYIAYPQGTSWTQPVKWKAFPNSRRGSEDALCVDPKTGMIIFSSDRKGSKGLKDLWITRRLPDGKFSEPENISELNTPENEDAPFIVGDTLFFAHDGPRSLGGYDIFYSVRQADGRWGKPQRLPQPINSPAHDSYLFFVHPDSLYLSSGRVGGLGNIDLYLIVKEPVQPPIAQRDTLVAPPARGYTLTGRVYDTQTQQLMLAVVRLVRLSAGDSVWQGEIQGAYQREKPPAGQYLIYAYAPGYAQYVAPLVVPDTGDMLHDIPMIPETVLKRIHLPRLHFNFDKYNLRTEAPAALDTVIQFLREYPTLCIEVAGHTDSIGTRAYNQGLSERRAHTVYKYLQEKGIPAYRLVPKGYSEDRPLVPNSTPYNRFLNRRVEFIPLRGKPATLE